MLNELDDIKLRIRKHLASNPTDFNSFFDFLDYVFVVIKERLDLNDRKRKS